MLLPLRVIPPIEIMDNMQCTAGASGNCRALIRSRCPGGGKSCWLFPVAVVVKCPVSVDVVVKCAFPAVPDLVAMPLIPMLIPIPSGPSGLQGLPAPVCCQPRPLYLYSSMGYRYIPASHILGWGGKGDSWWQNAYNMRNCACSCTSKIFFSLEFCGTVCQCHRRVVTFFVPQQFWDTAEANWA